MPALNELHSKLSERGLVIVGVSNESEALIQKTISARGVRYPIVRVTGDAVDSAYGVNGFPTMVSVDAHGKVAKLGHASEAELERLLAEVVLVPPLSDARHKSIQKLLDDRQWGKAHERLARAAEGAEAAAEEVPAEVMAAKVAIERLAAARLGGARRLVAEKAYWRAEQRLAELAESFSGMPEADAAATERSALIDDPAAADDLAAGKLLVRAQAEIAKGKKANVRNGREMLERIISKYAGTDCAQAAKALLGG